MTINLGLIYYKSGYVELYVYIAIDTHVPLTTPPHPTCTSTHAHAHARTHHITSVVTIFISIREVHVKIQSLL